MRVREMVWDSPHTGRALPAATSTGLPHGRGAGGRAPGAEPGTVAQALLTTCVATGDPPPLRKLFPL